MSKVRERGGVLLRRVFNDSTPNHTHTIEDKITPNDVPKDHTGLGLTGPGGYPAFSIAPAAFRVEGVMSAWL